MIPFEYDADAPVDAIMDDVEESAGRSHPHAVDVDAVETNAENHPPLSEPHVASQEEEGTDPPDVAESLVLTTTEPRDGESPGWLSSSLVDEHEDAAASKFGVTDDVIGCSEKDAPNGSERPLKLPRDENDCSVSQGFSQFPYYDVDPGGEFASEVIVGAARDADVPAADPDADEDEVASEAIPVPARPGVSCLEHDDRVASTVLGRDWLHRVLVFLQRQSTIRRLTCGERNMNMKKAADESLEDDDDDDITMVVHYYCRLSIPEVDEATGVAASAMSPSQRRRRGGQNRRIHAVLHVEPLDTDPTIVDVTVVNREDDAATGSETPQAFASCPVLRPAGATTGAPGSTVPSFEGLPTKGSHSDADDKNGTDPMTIDSEIDASGRLGDALSAVRPTSRQVHPTHSQPDLWMLPNDDVHAAKDHVPHQGSASTEERRCVPWTPHLRMLATDDPSHDLSSRTALGSNDSALGQCIAEPLSTANSSSRPPFSRTVATVLRLSSAPAEGIEDVGVRVGPSNLESCKADEAPAPLGTVLNAVPPSSPRAHSFQDDPPAALGDVKESERTTGPEESFIALGAAAGSTFVPSPVKQQTLEAVDSPSGNKERFKETSQPPTRSSLVESPPTGPAADAWLDSGTSHYGGSPRVLVTERSSPAMEEEDLTFPSPDPPTPASKDDRDSSPVMEEEDVTFPSPDPPTPASKDDRDDWIMYSSVPFRSLRANEESPTFPSPDPPTPSENMDKDESGWEPPLESSPPRMKEHGFASPKATYGFRSREESGKLDKIHESPTTDLHTPLLSTHDCPTGGNPRRSVPFPSSNAKGDVDPVFPAADPPRNNDVVDEGLSRRRDKTHKKKKKSKKHKRKRSSLNDPNSPHGDPRKSLRFELPPPAPERGDETSHRPGGKEYQLVPSASLTSFTEPVICHHEPPVRPRVASLAADNGAPSREEAGTLQHVSKRETQLESEPSKLKSILRTPFERGSQSNETTQLKNGADASKVTAGGSVPVNLIGTKNSFASKTTIEAAESMRSTVATGDKEEQEPVVEEGCRTASVARGRGSLTQGVDFSGMKDRDDEIVLPESKESPKLIRVDPTPDLPQPNRSLPLVWGSTRHFRTNIRFEQYRNLAPSTLVVQDKLPTVLPVSGQAPSRTSSTMLEPIESVRKRYSTLSAPCQDSLIPERSSSVAGHASRREIDDHMLASACAGLEKAQRQKWMVTQHMPRLSQPAEMNEATARLHESAGAGSENVPNELQSLSHHMPTLIHPSQPAGEKVTSVPNCHPESHVRVDTVCPIEPTLQGPAPVRALCSEGFLSLWGDVAAELGSGRWVDLSSGSSHANGIQSSTGRRIELMDSSLVDQCAVDIEINDWGLLLFTASALETSDDAKMVVLSVARLVVLGRYTRLIIFLSYDVPITDSIARHITQLQTAALCNGLKFPTDTVFKTTSPRTLSGAIAATVFAKVDARHLPHIDNATHPMYRLWAGFLLAICPKLCASGALKLLHLSRQVAPPNVNPLTFALKSEQFRRNIQEAIRTKSPTVSSIHPEAVALLEKALLAPLKPR